MSRRILLLNAPNDIKPILDELLQIEEELREDYQEEIGGTSKKEKEWKIIQMNARRSRIIFDAFQNKTISYKTYQYCCKYNICDVKLIAQWKKTGYEHLCCLQCIQSKKGTNNVCICRVPVHQRKIKHLQDVIVVVVQDVSINQRNVLK